MLSAGGVAKEIDDSHGLFVHGLDGTEERSLFVKHLSGIGVEYGRDAESVFFNKSIGSGVPSGVTSCLESGADAAVRERRGVRLGTDQLFAGEVHDDFAVSHRGDKAVVLLCGEAGHRLEPVGEMGGAVLNGPGLHGRSDLLRNLDGHGSALVDAGLQLFVSLFRESLLHDVVVEDEGAEDLRNIDCCHKLKPPV